MSANPAAHPFTTTPATTPSRGTVLVTAPGFDADGEDAGARLRAHGLSVRQAGPSAGRTPHEVAELARDAVAAIASADPFTAEVFAAAPQLRVIARTGVGVDSIDLDAATRAGVLVTTTPGLNDETCADHALALLLAATRRIVEHDASVRRGAWERGGLLTPWDLHGKRVGVVGHGRIGRAVVRRLEGFGVRIRILDPQLKPDDGRACSSLAELLTWAEVLTLHAPLTPETTGLIGRAELAALGPDAILVNTSRGGLVDEAALLDALAGGRLRAAGIDVFPDEPPRDRRWTELPNVVLSPHVGGLSVEALDAMMRRCVEQVLQALDGRVPDGCVNASALTDARA